MMRKYGIWNRKPQIFLCFLLSLLFLFPEPLRAESIEDSGFFTLVDEAGSVILQTGGLVSEGDLYINEQNERYIVESVNGKTAICRFDGIEILPKIGCNPKEAGVLGGENASLPVIAIYHTHDDESYVPSDGTESIRGDGGIYDVGETLRATLETMGFPVLYSEAKHDPHDVNAYSRSRETAAGLLRKGGEVLIDVHRDAVPPENYETEIDGQSATKIKLVVGKSNPNQQSNMEFAKQIKAAMDTEEPGLSAGIYEGKGDYNQDLTPEAILIEVGAHTNSKEDAETGVAAFARALPAALNVEKAAVMDPRTQTVPDNGGPQSTETDRPDAAAAKPLPEKTASRWNILWVVLILGAGAGCAYYLIQRFGNAEE